MAESRCVTYEVRKGVGAGWRFQDCHGHMPWDHEVELTVGSEYVVSPFRKNKKGAGQRGILIGYRTRFRDGDPCPRARLRDATGKEILADPGDLLPAPTGD